MRHAIVEFTRAIPEFLAYQVVTRLLLALGVLPLLTLTTTLLVSGRTGGAVTNATLVPFLTSWQGLLYVAVLIAILAWLLVTELGGAIVISARLRFDRAPAGYLGIVRHNLRRGGNLLEAGGALVLVYAGVLLPLTGTGGTVTLLEGLAVPRFVMAVIESTPAYLVGYLALMLTLTLLALALSYTFPLVIIGNLRAWAAIRASVWLTLRRPGVLVRHYLWPATGLGVLLVGVIVGWMLLVEAVFALSSGQAWQGPTLVFLLGVQQAGLLVFSMLLLPFQAQRITSAFYAALPEDTPLAALRTACPEVAERPATSRVSRLLVHPGRLGLSLATAVAVLIAAGSFPAFQLLSDSVSQRRQIELVAHRAGGNGAPENSLAGLEYALAQGADLVEIDIQRTADGHYVLNHDRTFARLTGDRREVSAMTLAEVKSLTLAGTQERVPTLEEFLRAARGRIRVLVELKGATADRRMGEDVVTLVHRLGMRGEVVLMSLNYPLVQFLEGVHPEMTTGYAYFWSIGDVSLLTADVIMLEEGEATPERLLAIAAAGKRAYVWTVNDEEGMRLMVGRGVSGIITDEVPAARRAIDESATMTVADLIRQLFGL